MREARVTVRGRPQTTTYRARYVANCSLVRHFVSDLSDQMATLPSDPNKTVQYHPLVMKGRVVR